MCDADFLMWVHDRMVNVYGENRNADFVRRLRSIAEALDADAELARRHREIVERNARGCRATDGKI